MKTTKQFKTLLQEQGAQVVFGDILDQATNEILTDYFYKRYINDDNDEDFLRMFHYNLTLCKRQYEEYLRIENVDFDPMVSRYLERGYKDEYAKKETETGNIKSNGTNKYTSNNKGSNGGTLTDNRVINTEDLRTDNLTETDQGSNSSNDKVSNVLSEFPQSNVEGYTGQNIDNISFKYANQMNVGKNDHSGTDSNTNHKTGTQKNEVGTTDVNTQTQNLTSESNTQFNGENSSIKTNDNETNSNYNLTHKEIYTGREGAPQEMLDRARTYIINTNAKKWLINQLDKCFMYLSYGEEY